MTPEQRKIVSMTKSVFGSAYKKYVAILEQIATGPITVNVLENDIGPIVWTKSATGLYQGYLANAFTGNGTYSKTKTIVFVSQNGAPNASVFGNSTGKDTVYLVSTDMTQDADGIHMVCVNRDFLSHLIEIRVYPE